MNPTMLAVLVFLGVFLLIMAIYVLTSRPAGQSAGRLTRMGPDGSGGGEAVLLKKRAAAARGLKEEFAKLVKDIFPAAPESVRASSYPQLVRAGYHRPDTVNFYFAMKLIMILVGLALFGIVYLNYPMSPTYILMWVASFGGLGYVLPDLWLNVRIRARQQDIRTTLPDALDLMIICLEAGLGMEATMTRVGKELERRGMPLGSELMFTSRQIEAGKPRNDAMRALALRTDIQEIKQLMTMLVQTERLGTGVASTLRTASDTIRTRKLQRAEAAAAKTSVKITFPLVMCMLPATFVVLLGPSFIPFLKAFKNNMGGG